MIEKSRLIYKFFGSHIIGSDVRKTVDIINELDLASYAITIHPIDDRTMVVFKSNNHEEYLKIMKRLDEDDILTYDEYYYDEM